jgi:hypothetical protein
MCKAFYLPHVRSSFSLSTSGRHLLHSRPAAPPPVHAPAAAPPPCTLAAVPPPRMPRQPGSASQSALRLPRPSPACSRPPPGPCLPLPRRAQEGATTQLPAPETAVAAPPPGARAGRRGSASSHARPPSRPRLPAPSPQSRLPACPGSCGSASQSALRLPRPRPARSRPPPGPCLPLPRRAQEGATTQLPAPETAAAAPPPGARAGRRGSPSSHPCKMARLRLPAPASPHCHHLLSTRFLFLSPLTVPPTATPLRLSSRRRSEPPCGAGDNDVRGDKEQAEAGGASRIRSEIEVAPQRRRIGGRGGRAGG